MTGKLIFTSEGYRGRAYVYQDDDGLLIRFFEWQPNLKSVKGTPRFEARADNDEYARITARMMVRKVRP